MIGISLFGCEVWKILPEL